MIKIKTWIKDNWTDPVWSKVFAAIIVATVGFLATFLFSLVKQIPIADLYFLSISKHITVSYFTLFILLIIVLSFLVPAIMLDIVRIQLKHIISSKKGIKQIVAEKKFESLFPGKWLNTYRFKDGTTGNEILEIKNRNEYHALGKHLFNITAISIDENSGVIRFMKNGIGDDKRTAVNTLRVINSTLYEGEEFDGTKIVYTRIE